MNERPRLLTSREVCDRLGVGARTLRAWMATSRALGIDVPRVVLGYRTVRWHSIDQVVAWAQRLHQSRRCEQRAGGVGGVRSSSTHRRSSGGERRRAVRRAVPAGSRSSRPGGLVALAEELCRDNSREGDAGQHVGAAAPTKPAASKE
jgi:predicted DNA-binding transcriptional regulator AlpA